MRALALSIYATVLAGRSKDADVATVRKAAEELLNGVDWALPGTEETAPADTPSGEKTKGPVMQGLHELRD